jgi:hypothetical protein
MVAGIGLATKELDIDQQLSEADFVNLSPSELKLLPYDHACLPVTCSFDFEQRECTASPDSQPRVLIKVHTG